MSERPDINEVNVRLIPSLRDLNSEFEAFAASMNLVASAMSQWTDCSSLLLAGYRRRRMARRALGYTSDPIWLPSWVRSVHEQQVETFGTGNGRRT